MCIRDSNTTVDTYNATFVWRDPSTVSAYISTAPSLNAHDNVVISGLSTTEIKGLSGSHKIGIDTAQTVLYQEVPNSTTTGIVTDIYVANIPENISIGSSIGIGTEKLLVLNTFNQNNVLRVQRGLSSGIHSVSTPVSLIPNFFNISLQTKVFDSKLNDQVYFNPHESIGVGTAVGLGSTATSTLGDLISVVSTPTRSIRLPNHPFKTNQRVTLTKPGKFKGQVGYALTVSKDDGVTTFNPTYFMFDDLVYLKNDTEYCIVPKPELDDPGFEIWIAELGANQFGTTNRIDKQPHSGMFFSSANNRTWTQNQNQDMMFIIVCAFSVLMLSTTSSHAYRTVEASLLAPFEYVAIPFSIFWGIAIFGDWPSNLSWIGMGLILFGGVYAIYRERVKEIEIISKVPMPASAAMYQKPNLEKEE